MLIKGEEGVTEKGFENIEKKILEKNKKEKVTGAE